VTLQQQGALQFQTVQINPLHNFSGTVTVSLSGLPVGVAATPPGPYSLSVSNSSPSVSFQLSAALNTPTGNSTINVTATSGSITHSETFSVSVTQAAPFTIHVSPSSLSIAPGMLANVQVSVTSNLSPPPQLMVSIPDPLLFPGINIGPPESLLTPSHPVTFFINPTPLAQPFQNYPFLITASDNSNNASAFTLPLTVSVPYSSNTTPTRSTFARTDQSPTGMVYDQARKLLFVSVEILNEVVVLSSVDGHLVATIPVNYPAGIDEAADGSAVYVVSPYFWQVTTIDPNLFQVVHQSIVPMSVSGSKLPPAFFEVAALSNGKVLLLLAGEDPTQPPFFLWDPTTDLFSRFGQTIYTPIAGLITRSADHTKVLGYGNGAAILYDVTTDSFTGPFNSVGGLLAIGPDGSQIVSSGLQNSPTVFYDSNFNVLASLPLDVFPVTGVLYSLDGKYAYIFQQQTNSGGDVGIMVDTKTFAVVGVVPAFSFGASLPFSGQWITTFATDETNMLFGSAFRGVGFLDMSSPTFLKLPLPGPFQVQPELTSLSSPTQAQLDGSGFLPGLTFNLFVGAPPASPQSLMATNVSIQSASFLNVTIPSGTTGGPANAALTRSDGFFEVMPDGVTFGPTILRVDADTGSPAGGDAIQIVGYGLNSSNLQVTIGGKAAAIGEQIGSVQGNLFPTEGVKLTTPSGSPGDADVTVTTPSGSITLTGGFHYANSVQVYPKSGLLDAITYDQARHRLYVTNQNNNRVEIFDLGSNSYLAPVPVGNTPTALALTPDGQLLAVVNAVDGTVSVIDPVKMMVIATYPLLTSSDMGNGCAGVVVGMAPAEPHRMLVDVDCPATLDAGLLHLINLDTGSLICTGVAGCSSNGTDINVGNNAMASTPDGAKIFLASTSLSGGPVSLLDLQANTLTSGFSATFADAAASADRTIYAASFGIADAQLAPFSTMAYEFYADSGNQSFHNVFGEKLSPSGSLLFVPQDSGVDIFDVHTGRLAQHLVLPDPIPQNTNALALDETGTKLFLTSSTGVTIAQLHDLPLSLATLNPASGPPGTSVTLRGSGFQNGATVTFGTTQVSATFVDSNTIQTTVPSLPAGSVRITVTNPDGHSYSFDDAFAVN
jgi:YVTN family beta-propeller protein